MPRGCGWRTQAGGLVAAMYGPSSVRFRTPDGVCRARDRETNYPFSERIEFRVEAPKPVRFALTLRIPGWAAGSQTYLNQRELDARLEPGSFARIEQEFHPGDTLRLTLPMRLKMTAGPITVSPSSVVHWCTP